MRSRNYKTEGIILKRQNLSEADRILTVFTKNHGKINCIAKGARRPISKKSAHVELFHRTVLYLAKGKNLDIVTQAEVVERFSTLSSYIKATKAAYHVVELVDQLTRENQENEELFYELANILRLINQNNQASKKQILEFEIWLLNNLGFGVPKSKTTDAVSEHIEGIIEKNLKTKEIFKEV